MSIILIYKQMRNRIQTIAWLISLIIILTAGSLTLWYITRAKHAANETSLCQTVTNNPEKLECISHTLTEELKHTPSATLLARAEGLQQQGVIADCHEVSHAIGKAILEKHNGDVGKAFLDCTHNCVDGCFHGVMETKVANSLHDQGSLQSLLTKTCSEIPGPIEHRQCVHGIGHGLAGHGALTFTEALDACLAMPSDDDRSACSSGVLMEHVSLFLYIKNQDIPKIIPTICEESKKIDAAGKPGLYQGCLSAIGQGLMLFTGDDLARSITLCNELPAPEAEICAWSAKQENEDHRQDLLQGR